MSNWIINTIMVLTIILTSAGQLCLKKASGSFSLQNLTTNYFIWIGLSCYVISTVMYLVVLKHVKLLVAFPVVIGGSNLLVVLLAYFFIGEFLKLHQIGGVLLVVSGICLLSMGQ
ncbi:MAG: hypothetical protein KAS99_04215 [Candidatus Omnitrophica bacterium]|nr:hypothetical protein [Candidatus Omnitrophota bacterium]